MGTAHHRSYLWKVITLVNFTTSVYLYMFIFIVSWILVSLLVKFAVYVLHVRVYMYCFTGMVVRAMLIKPTIYLLPTTWRPSAVSSFNTVDCIFCVLYGFVQVYTIFHVFSFIDEVKECGGYTVYLHLNTTEGKSVGTLFFSGCR